jgi:hypothetical protein
MTLGNASEIACRMVSGVILNQLNTRAAFDHVDRQHANMWRLTIAAHSETINRLHGEIG